MLDSVILNTIVFIMSVFYKFKSALTCDTIQFDDLHISLQDFKKAIIQQKQLGKNTNFDLQVMNAETNEVYTEDNSLIPKNSSLIVVRVPLVGVQKKWDMNEQLSSKIGVISSDYLQENAGSVVVKSADLAALNASEDEKIQAMMFQSTVDYDPANYLRVKGGSQYGDPPATYVCHKCHHPGHWIKDCPITVVPDVKKSSGIPQSFMTPVEDPSAPGALMTPAGKFAVPTIDMVAYKQGKVEKPFIPSEETEESLKPTIPEDLLCTLCQDLLTDAVMMPCCGNSFCDECIRNILLESEDNQCPDCKEKDTSPETLIPNRFLRNAVNNFRNKTGYKGGGQRIKRDVAERRETPTIGQYQDIEIVDAVPDKVNPETESNSNGEKEKGSAIVVLDSSGRGLQPRTARTNGAQVATIHSGPHVNRSVTLSTTEVAKDSQRALVKSSLKSSPDLLDSDRKNSSPGLGNVSSVIPAVKKYTVPPPSLPNTSQLPPGYSQQTLQPIGSHFGSSSGHRPGVAPIARNYGPPRGINPMVMPPHMASQASSARMYPSYNGLPPMYGQVSHGFRGGLAHHRMRHHESFPDMSNVVEDPLVLFERHLKERERQDRMKRNRGRRSRSRSLSRDKSYSRGRPRSRSRSIPLKRSRSPLLIARKDSPLMKRDSRTPPLRRSKSKSRSRTRLRSHSRSHGPRNIGRRSQSHSPLGQKIKRSPSPTAASYSKPKRTPILATKKSMRLNHSRSRTRSRTRSASIVRMRKRRRTRSRSISVNSRSASRGRSYSRSISPVRRTTCSPKYTLRTKRSRTPPKLTPMLPNVRIRSGGRYRESPPYHCTTSTDRYKRNYRNARFPRGGSRYYSDQFHDSANKYDRHGGGPPVDRYGDKRYVDVNNGRDYSHSSDITKSHVDYYSSPVNDYNQYTVTYEEVPPPGTTDIPDLSYPTNVVVRQESEYDSRTEPYHSPEYKSGADSLKSSTIIVPDNCKQSNDNERDREHDHYRLKSRESERQGHSHQYHHHHHVEHEKKRDDNGSRHAEIIDSKKDLTPEGDKWKKESDDRKEDSREKKEKSKRKKKKEVESEKKKRKKLKGKKEDEPKNEDGVSEESKTHESEVNEDLYDGIDDTNIDKQVIENYGKIVFETITDSGQCEKSHLKGESAILACVPELSKWEREDVISPSEEQKGADAKCENKEKKVTTEILKRAENALFLKSETAREAKKSGNSIQVTVPAVLSDDENRPPSRISAKDRLGAKVVEKSIFTTVRSLVEPKMKPRSTVKAVVEMKKNRTDAGRYEKNEEQEKYGKHEEKTKKDTKRYKHKEPKENKVKRKNSRKSEEEEEEAAADDSKILDTFRQKDTLKGESNDNRIVSYGVAQEKENKNSTNDVKAMLDKKRPIIDEASFEPDYDLTESEGEIDSKSEVVESMRKHDDAALANDPSTLKLRHIKEIEKTERNTEEITSSESSSDSSAYSSTEHKRRKKRKMKKKKKVKKCRAGSSSDVETEETSEAESDFNTKHKHKKKRKHKAKKSSKSARKKKKTRHK